MADLRRQPRKASQLGDTAAQPNHTVRCLHQQSERASCTLRRGEHGGGIDCGCSDGQSVRRPSSERTKGRNPPSLNVRSAVCVNKSSPV
jgi:hypothetical protein